MGLTTRMKYIFTAWCRKKIAIAIKDIVSSTDKVFALSEIIVPSCHVANNRNGISARVSENKMDVFTGAAFSII